MSKNTADRAARMGKPCSPRVREAMQHLDSRKEPTVEIRSSQGFVEGSSYDDATSNPSTQARFCCCRAKQTWRNWSLLSTGRNDQVKVVWFVCGCFGCGRPFAPHKIDVMPFLFSASGFYSSFCRPARYCRFIVLGYGSPSRLSSHR